MTVEQLIISHLAERISVPVSSEVPASMPAEFVTVEKTGSAEKNLIRTATLAVQSWGTTRLAAAELNERVKIAMDAATELSAVSRSHCDTDYNFTDPETKRHRYQAVYEVTYYLR